MPEAVIVAATRSPIGRAFKGSLVDVRPDDMGAEIIKALISQVPALDPAEIADIICGNIAGAGEAGYNLGRNIGILAGLPETVPGHTVNRFCASSTQAIRQAFHAIKAGEGTAYIAAGIESTSRTSGAMVPGPNPLLDGQHPPFPDVYIPMGLTAENVAEQFKVSREDQDAFAKLSQDRATAAQENGVFEREITPIKTPDGTIVDKDDCPRPGTTLEKLAQLQPAFKEGGTVTAGNACPLNDGAAAVLVMSEDRARELGLTPKVRILGGSVSGLAPEIMGVGPIEAVRKVLDQTGMTIGDVDVVELNEAFAAQVLPVCRELGIDVDTQLNPHGGAIALGHPFGQTGARIMTTLINDLETLDKTIGLETMCVGGGQGMALLVERIG
ncbi:MAG TPA: acetyl-CoA C-acyltransferase [Acidimicrobiia bacterium]|nr:acetyl-CoA C-acyltransferase [Acidimicrobiia bacterium]